MSAKPRFEFRVDPEVSLGDKLLVGYASPGMASLVASNHLVTAESMTQAGHAKAHDLPTIIPFNEGTPRYPSRLYADGAGTTVVVSERFLPLEIGDRFGDAIIELAIDHDVEEVTVLYGVPYPHGPEDHAVFSVATEGYSRPDGERGGVSDLGGGFLDSVPGTLLEAGLEMDTLEVGVYVTPTHPPGPDFEAALRLLKTAGSHFDTTIDTTQLEAKSEEINRYYEELAARIEAENKDRDLPEDRMYM